MGRTALICSLIVTSNSSAPSTPAIAAMRVSISSLLREEILRSKTGMLMRIAELAGIEGMIELEVTVNEEIRAARPIKLEDRVRYITEKNPLVAELRKALDLEVE